MKGFTEMTEQEILALTEEDVQKMIKLRMMEEGIKIMDKPKIPELFEIEPADIQYFSIPLLDGFAFTDINEATKVAEILKSAKSLRKVDYDWNKLGSDYKFLKKSERYKFNGYERLNRLTYKFATDYYPLSDHNEDMAMKFMAKAYSFTDKEKEYILQNYKELLSTSDE